MSRNLVLIASYPKSGSTWLRLVLENLQRAQAVSINAMSAGYYGHPRRLLFDDVAPVNAADLLTREIDVFLPEVFRQLSLANPGKVIVKVHDRARRTNEGGWLFPPECVHGAIHIVRHPFDVAVSYAHHLGADPARAVELMSGREDAVVADPRRRLPLPLHEQIGSWSEHADSWQDCFPYPVTLARFEDLHADPVAGFPRLAAAAGLSVSDDRVARAVEATQFDRLRNEERAQGFRERPRTAATFFRAGRPRSWGEELGEDLRERLLSDHGAVMERLGYRADGGAVPLAEGPAS